MSSDTPSPSTIPDALVIGAGKSGTTTLHSWLMNETQIRLPVMKETRFFTDADRYAQGIQWYGSQFPDSEARITVEVDPHYLPSQAAARRVAHVAPSAQLHVILRNPLHRAYSHYLMNVSKGRETRTFRDALAAEVEHLGDPEFATERLRAEVSVHPRAGSQQMGTYVWQSLYDACIREWERVGGPINIVLFDDLFGEEAVARATYRELLERLGVTRPDARWSPSVHSNPARVVRYRRVARLVHAEVRSPWIRGLGRRAPALLRARQRIVARLSRFNSRASRVPAMPQASSLPIEARTLLAKDIAALEHRTGRSLSHWLATLDLQ